MKLAKDPFEHLIITRKRKKYKFASFDSYQNCFSFSQNDDPKTLQQQLTSYLQEEQPLVLEIAAGNAQFSLELARRHPQYNFIAIDIKSDRLYTSAKQALEEGVTNIAFVRMHLAGLTQVFGKKSVATIWLTFPDPFMRKRSIRRRLTHPLFLQQYRKILEPTGKLQFKTDNRELFLWSLEQFVAEKWQFNELTFDLHDSELSEDYKVKTHYEERFTAQGIPTNFCGIMKELK